MIGESGSLGGLLVVVEWSEIVMKKIQLNTSCREVPDTLMSHPLFVFSNYYQIKVEEMLTFMPYMIIKRVYSSVF